jgi:hypothetical protein
MAKKTSTPSFDFAAFQSRIQNQFTGLDPNDRRRGRLFRATFCVLPSQSQWWRRSGLCG